MIARIIEFSIRNKYLVLLAWLGIAMWGLFAILHTPVDAIPDLSENQVIVFADWMGRSPQEIEDQITYPLSVQLQGLAGVKTVRSSSEPNFSMISVIFDDKTDPYFARTRILERLTTARAALPAEVTPQLAPDANALGQIFWYTVEGDGHPLDELRAVQDFTVRYQLSSIPGVAEVASVGGFVREYQVDIDPNKLRLYDLPLSAVYSAIANSNMSVGAKAVVQSNTEYLIRGLGWLRGIKDLELVEVANRGGVPITLKQLAAVQLGPEFRRSALEKDGQEAVGGVVMMRFGQNPLEVTKAIKARIRDLTPGLPAGVRIVPFYERTRLIESAIHTVTGTLKEEMIIASLAILLILTHLRSALVVCITLPMAVLTSFLLMYYLDMPSNIMSLCGIAISIGILVDAAVVMVENASHQLKEHFGNEKVRGDTTEIVVSSCRLVGRPIFFSVVIMLLSFLPVFALRGMEGKLAHPLAFTKSFAMIGVALMAITLVPALIPILIKGRLKSEEQNWIVRSFINIYKPVLTWMVDRPAAVWWLMAVILVLGAGFFKSPVIAQVALAVVLGLIVFFVSGSMKKLALIISIVAIALFADTRFKKLGSEFKPDLDEGSLIDMPTASPRIAMAQAVDDVRLRDKIIRSFPEVEQVVGKIGRADTATDPSPVEMVETIINLHPIPQWPRRKIDSDDATTQAALLASKFLQRGYLKKGIESAHDIVHTATEAALIQFDRAMREYLRLRQDEYRWALADQLGNDVIDSMTRQIESNRAILRPITVQDRGSLAKAARDHTLRLATLPRQEELDALLNHLRTEMIASGLAQSRDDLLSDRPTALIQAITFLKSSIGAQNPTFAERTFRHLEDRRNSLIAEHVKTLDHELFDHAVSQLNAMLMDAILRAARGTPFAGTAEPIPDEINRLAQEASADFGKKLFLWQKTKADLQKEMDAELQMPGWGNTWTQPIQNRVNMLATGVRTQIGVKVFGPIITGISTGDLGLPSAGSGLGSTQDSSVTAAISKMQSISDQIAARLRTVPGASDVNTDQAMGKRYLEIHVDREKLQRYGVNIADVNQAIETALGGSKITMTVEGRQRFPIRLRYARDYWQDIDAVGNVLVTGAATPASLTDLNSSSGAAAQTTSAKPASGMSGGMSTSSSAAPPGMSAPSSIRNSQSAIANSSIIQIPLKTVADIRVTEGPAMIKSENGRLRNYVTLNVRDRDLLGFVEEARQALKPIEAQLAGTGMSIEWSGDFEHQMRTNQTMALILPMVFILIFFLLFLTFHDVLDTLLVILAVLGALSGAVMFQALFGFNFSVIVWIGYIAAFGMATQTGVIMLVYLREALDKHGGLENISSLDVLRTVVIQGAVHRLRPKLLTEGVAIIGLVPMLWATGTGAEIMRPMAAPVLGGLLISDEVIDLMIPVLFYQLRKRRWLKLHRQDATHSQSELLVASAFQILMSSK